ncbi:MAG TPA: Nramp family divalent metal transporter [Phycisphaerae bacterium]|nr:Nramp family divalent metal transporter [Phycisphaerae bacterium]
MKPLQTDIQDISLSPAVPAPRQASLEQVHSTVRVPQGNAGFWRAYLAFAGPALLISVGYMDPGNWSTDLQAGAQFKYQLLWIVGLSSLMAIILQVISARLGVATGRDLAQHCRDHLWAWTRWPNWLSCEVAIAACDLAEVLGSAVALHLLFPRISLLLAVIITAFDVLILLALQRFGMRLIEAVILVLVATIATCFFIEIFVLPQTRPDFGQMGQWLFAPDMPKFFKNGDMVFIAIGIIGATVMPHNLYLHSALVQSRQLRKDDQSMRKALRFNSIDTTVALGIAFFVNAAILVMAALVFFGHDHVALASGQTIKFDDNTDWIQAAYLTLAPLLGTFAASLFFAIGLFASGQSSTITGTLAGQVVMEGFMHWKIQPWVRRLITRLCAITPAIVLVAQQGVKANVNDMLNLSQVVLAIQLPLAMIPLMFFASLKRFMGQHRLGWFLLIAGWATVLIITALDIYGLPDAWRQGIVVFTGHGGN